MPNENPPCLLHSDSECETCYPVSKRAGVRPRPRRPPALPRRTLARATQLSVEERVNIKVLAPILHAEEKQRYVDLIAEPLTEEELNYLIENRLDSGE